MNKHKLVLEILGGTELLWLCWIVGFFCGKGTLAGVGLTKDDCRKPRPLVGGVRQST